MLQSDLSERKRYLKSLKYTLVENCINTSILSKTTCTKIIHRVLSKTSIFQQWFIAKIEPRTPRLPHPHHPRMCSVCHCLSRTVRPI